LPRRSAVRRGGGRRSRFHTGGSDSATGLANDSDDAVNGDRFTFFDFDFGEHPRRGRRDLGVDLVGGDLKQRLVALDGVSNLFYPSDDRAFGNGFAHLGHDHWSWHSQFSRSG
jgi:hypothetical protein